MPNFAKFSDEEIVNFVFENLDKFDAQARPGQKEMLLSSLARDQIAVEKCEEAFAIVARANRRHDGVAGDIFPINPEANLMFLYVDQEHQGKGIGKILVKKVKDRFMEDQAMTLVCKGEKRKRYFEELGFVFDGLTVESMNDMSCPAPISSLQ